MAERPVLAPLRDRHPEGRDLGGARGGQEAAPRRGGEARPLWTPLRGVHDRVRAPGSAYKRADLVFSDPGRLAAIAEVVGPLQLVFAGKAHPRDAEGKDLIRRVFRFANDLRGRVTVVYLAEYDLELAKLLVSGVDLWLNTPLAPLDASGTSGMKAAHNGVPSLSTLDGWWVEGHVEGVTGWSIGGGPEASSPAEERRKQDADDLYRKLGEIIVPMFYRDRERWLDVMRQTHRVQRLVLQHP